MSPVPLGWSLPRGAVQGELLGHCLAWRELDPLLQTGLLGLALPTLGQGGTYPRGKSKAAILLSFPSFALRRGWSSKRVRKEPPDIPGAVAAGSGVLWWSWSGALSQREQEGKALCFPLACSVGSWLPGCVGASQFPVRALSSSGQGMEGRVSVWGQPGGLSYPPVRGSS